MDDPNRVTSLVFGPLTLPALPPLHLPRRPSGTPPPRTAPAPSQTAVTAATTTPRARGTIPPSRRMATAAAAVPSPSPSERPRPARGCATPPPDAVPLALARATTNTRDDSPRRNPTRSFFARRPRLSRPSPAARSPRRTSRDWAAERGFEPRPPRRTFASPIPQPRSSSWEVPARGWRRRIRS